MKKNNPINSISLKLARYKKDLAESHETLINLREEHSRLIKESIKLERDFGKLEDSITNMCDGCSEKNTDECRSCSLFDSAIEFDLWN